MSPDREHPEQLDDRDAVRLAHSREIVAAATHLTAGLSVLIRCTEDLVPHLGAEIKAALLPETRERLLVLAELSDDEPEPPRTVLAFLDPQRPLPRSLRETFPVRLSLTPPAPLLHLDGETVPLARALVTRSEAASFAAFDEAAAYRYVAGLSVIRVRQLFRTLAGAAPGSLPLARLGQEAALFGVERGPANALEMPIISLAEVSGRNDVKAELARLLKSTAIRPAGIMLHGPGGTGKTTLAHAIAHETNASLVILRCRSLTYRGDQVVKSALDLLDLARRVAPSVVLVDDLDALGQDDTTASGLIATLVEEIGRFPAVEPMMLVVTSRSAPVDPGLLRPDGLRAIPIDLPDLATRRELAATTARRFGMPVGEALLDAVAQATERFSCVDLVTTFASVADVAGPELAFALGEQVGRQIQAIRSLVVAERPSVGQFVHSGGPTKIGKAMNVGAPDGHPETQFTEVAKRNSRGD